MKSISRGYSDLCAALCAAALDAQELQIWKEVDGIFTADPSKIKAARLLTTITSEEAAELTHYGSEVIHPLTIEQLVVAKIPLRLKNVMKPTGPGTIIYPSYKPLLVWDERTICDRPPICNTDDSILVANNSFMIANGYFGPNNCCRTPTAVTAKEGILLLTLHS